MTTPSRSAPGKTASADDSRSASGQAGARALVTRSVLVDEGRAQPEAQREDAAAGRLLESGDAAQAEVVVRHRPHQRRFGGGRPGPAHAPGEAPAPGHPGADAARQPRLPGRRQREHQAGVDGERSRRLHGPVVVDGAPSVAHLRPRRRGGQRQRRGDRRQIAKPSLDGRAHLPFLPDITRSATDSVVGEPVRET